jgi:hypothetical protein
MTYGTLSHPRRILLRPGHPLGSPNNKEAEVILRWHHAGLLFPLAILGGGTVRGEARAAYDMPSPKELMAAINVDECNRGMNEAYASLERGQDGGGIVRLFPFDSSAEFELTDLEANRGRAVGRIKSMGKAEVPRYGIKKDKGEVCVFMVLPLKESTNKSKGVAVIVDPSSGEYLRAFPMQRKDHPKHKPYACWGDDEGFGDCPDEKNFEQARITAAKKLGINAVAPPGAVWAEWEILSPLVSRGPLESGGPWFSCGRGGCCKF